MSRIAVLCLLALGLAGCFLRPEESAPAYPETLDLEFVSLDDLRFTVAAPDTFAVIVYVTSVIECPPDHDCFLPDGITIAENSDPSPSEGVFIPVHRPSSLFIQAARYILSIRIQDSQVNQDTGERKRHYHLLHSWRFH